MKLLRHLITVLFLFVTITATAHDDDYWNKRWSITPSLGLGCSSWLGEYYSDFDLGFAWRIGALAEYSFNKTWSISSGLNILSMNTKSNYVSINNVHMERTTFNQVYLDIPVLCGTRIKISDKINLLLKYGAYLDFGIGGKTKFRDRITYSINTFDLVTSTDLGLDLRVYLELNDVVFGIETHNGLRKLFKNPDATNGANLVSIGYRFGIEKKH